MGVHKTTPPPQKTKFNRAYRFFKISKKKLADLFGQVLYFCVRKTLFETLFCMVFYTEFMSLTGCVFFFLLTQNSRNTQNAMRSKFCVILCCLCAKNLVCGVSHRIHGTHRTARRFALAPCGVSSVKISDSCVQNEFYVLCFLQNS